VTEFVIIPRPPVKTRFGGRRLLQSFDPSEAGCERRETFLPLTAQVLPPVVPPHFVAMAVVTKDQFGVFSLPSSHRLFLLLRCSRSRATDNLSGHQERIVTEVMQDKEGNSAQHTSPSAFNRSCVRVHFPRNNANCTTAHHVFVSGWTSYRVNLFPFPSTVPSRVTLVPPTTHTSSSCRSSRLLESSAIIMAAPEVYSLAQGPITAHAFNQDRSREF